MVTVVKIKTTVEDEKEEARECVASALMNASTPDEIKTAVRMHRDYLSRYGFSAYLAEAGEGMALIAELQGVSHLLRV